MKKKILQLFLIIFTLLIAFLTFEYYLKPQNKGNKTSPNTENQITDENKNNLIKNLIYNVKLNDDSTYNITAELSELTYENGIEIVLMQKVTSVFVDKNGTKLKITADYAVFNNKTYSSDFSKNVKIQYLENMVYSDKLNLNFTDNIATITENVIYEGIQGVLTTDNVIIDLITKNVEVFMNNPKSKVEIIKKNKQK